MKFLFTRPVTWIALRFSSFPKQANVSAALDELYKNILNGDTRKGRHINIDPKLQSIIIFSGIRLIKWNNEQRILAEEEELVQLLSFPSHFGL